jgi:hypothetical protein
MTRAVRAPMPSTAVTGRGAFVGARRTRPCRRLEFRDLSGIYSIFTESLQAQWFFAHGRNAR